MYSAKSHILQEKPPFIIVPGRNFTHFFPITVVKDASIIAENGLWLNPIETNFSFVIFNYIFKFFFELFEKALLIFN